MAQIQALMPACTIRKRIRKIPVRPMMNFLPTEELKKAAHFIRKSIGFCDRPDVLTPVKALSFDVIRPQYACIADFRVQK
jgi:hypothetical protein